MTAMNDVNLNAMLEERMEERKRQDQQQLREMEEHARCVLLPSPDILHTPALQGEDGTDTLGDYAEVLDWLTKRDLLNTGFYKPEDLETIKGKQKLPEERFGPLVQLAFGHAFAPLLHTGDLERHELVFWYYAGHGLGKANIEEVKNSEGVKKLEGVSAIPNLNKVDLNVDYSIAAEFMPESHTRTVKGGELCLHDVGFCDLSGVLEAWIAALKGPSINIRAAKPHVKRNKHLVLIVDSCYSGTFANDLNTLAQTRGPWNENGCTVTVQASCSADEPTFGRYFTPLFLHLNQHPKVLDELKEEWEGMDEKTTFSFLPHPSPVVATTRNEEGNHNLTKKIECQNFSIVLFPDAGFFKYCFVRCFEKQNHCLRSLTPGLEHKFLSQRPFTVLDYKLKKVSAKDRKYANTPMGLFLVDVPDSKDCVVCVHLHFPLNDTTSVSRINLVHHLRPGPGHIIYEEQPATKIPIPIGTEDAKDLVKACHDEVGRCEMGRCEIGRWDDHSKWNMMKYKQLGVKGLFRLRECLKQRSQNMNKYLQSLDI